MSSKRFHYDAALKIIIHVHAAEHGDGAVGREFTISEAPICSSKPTTITFTGPKKRRHPDAAGLHFVKETRAKGMPITRQAMQVKATETAKSLGITDFEAGHD
jgi:hypothetical protein